MRIAYAMQCIGNKLLMISIVVQFIGIALLILIIVVQCIGILAYDKHSCAVH